MKILLNGVDGNFGGKAAEVLLDKWPHENLVFAAPTEKGLQKYANTDVEKRLADFNDEEGLVRAFSGIDTMVLISMRRIYSDCQRSDRTRSKVCFNTSTEVHKNLPDDFIEQPHHYYTVHSSGHEMMKTDIRDKGSYYEMEINLPGIKKKEEATAVEGGNCIAIE